VGMVYSPSARGCSPLRGEVRLVGCVPSVGCSLPAEFRSLFPQGTTVTSRVCAGRLGLRDFFPFFFVNEFERFRVLSKVLRAWIYDSVTGRLFLPVESRFSLLEKKKILLSSVFTGRWVSRACFLFCELVLRDFGVFEI